VPSGRAGRREAASSVAPIDKAIGAPCVLASHSPSAPGPAKVIMKRALSMLMMRMDIPFALRGAAMPEDRLGFAIDVGVDLEIEEA